jgi:hypothetical protein
MGLAGGGALGPLFIGLAKGTAFSPVRLGAVILFAGLSVLAWRYRSGLPLTPTSPRTR